MGWKALAGNFGFDMACVVCGMCLTAEGKESFNEPITFSYIL